MTNEQFVELSLKLESGDIVVLEMTDKNTTENELFPFGLDNKIYASHFMMWIKDNERPLAHAVNQGYHLPGVRLTKLPEGRALIYRYKGEKSALADKAAEIFLGWALSSKPYSREDYLKTYPKQHWSKRQDKDLHNFFRNGDAKISGPATPYGEPRATYDFYDRARDPSLALMRDEGLRRAIKFASRQKLTSPDPISKGQQCTSILVAAYQAAILAPIVKQGNKVNMPFKAFKGKRFEEYADEVLIPGWRETELGQCLLNAHAKNDYSDLFTDPFAIDQRYVGVEKLYDDLSKAPDFELIGCYSYLTSRIETVDKDNIHTAKNDNLAAPGPSNRT